MSVRNRKDIDRSAKAAAERGAKSAAKSSRAGALMSSAGRRTFTLPAIDHDHLTVISLFIIVALMTLNFMLRFPELGAVIASYNQF